LYDKFRHLIEERNLSVYKVAKDTGIAQSVLSAWKTGISTPKLGKLVKIAAYLNVKLEELI